jgi:hypothetical protein
MKTKPLTACKHYCLAAGATQGNIAYTQTVSGKQCEPANPENYVLNKLHERI